MDRGVTQTRAYPATPRVAQSRVQQSPLRSTTMAEPGSISAGSPRHSGSQQQATCWSPFRPSSTRTSRSTDNYYLGSPVQRDNRRKRLSKSSKTSSSTTTKTSWASKLLCGCFPSAGAATADDHTTVYRGSTIEFTTPARKSSMLDFLAPSRPTQQTRQQTQRMRRGCSYDDVLMARFRRESPTATRSGSRHRRRSFDESYQDRRLREESGFMNRACQNAVTLPDSDFDDISNFDDISKHASSDDDQLEALVLN